MSAPLVSIITPSYNQGECIEDTIVSIKNQTYPNVEHLVIDGGSTDETIELLEQHTETYDLRWVSESDEGQSDAINKGFEMADGDIVAWINSDDVYFDTGVLERVVKYFDKYDDEIIYGDQVLLDKYSKIQSVDIRPDFDREKLSHRILLGQAATFFRADVIKNETLRTDLDYCLDYEYWLRPSQKYSFRHVDDILAGFRLYDAQKSQSMIDMSEEFDRIMAEYPSLSGKSARTIVSNIEVELVRWTRAVQQTWRLHAETPELAFDGELASLSAMLLDIPPDSRDLLKVLKRLGT